MYIAQSAVGAGNGADCGNAYRYTFFNNSANWGSGTTQIGPGTTVHICGKLTLAAGGSAFTFQGSGVSGNPVTLKFEAGASITAPYFSVAIQTAGKSHIVIDGGGTGVIQATLAGTSGGTCPGGPCQYQVSEDGIDINACNDCTVQNLTIADLYDHSSTGDSSGDGSGIYFSSSSSTNITVQNVTIHDSRYGIFLQYQGSSSNITFANNTIYNCDGSIIVGSGNSGDAVSNVSIHDNDIHDAANWDTTADTYHHDGIHVWAVQSNNPVTNITIYNNFFHGNFGANSTSFTYFEQYSGTAISGVKIFNNVYAPTGGNADIWFEANASSTISASVYNNTLSNPGYMIAIYEETTGISVDIRNNIIYNSGTGFLNYSSLGTMDYNNWYLAKDYLFQNNNSGYNTLSAWQSATGLDTHSRAVNPNLDANYRPQAGSPAIGLATNLTSLGIPALNVDKAGVVRPSVGAWDAGAYQFTSSQPPLPPIGLTAIVH